jgi:hypothetical protein
VPDKKHSAKPPALGKAAGTRQRAEFRSANGERDQFYSRKKLKACGGV